MHKKKAVVITILFGLNAAISIITQIIIAKLFGAGKPLDSFLIAVTLPSIIVGISYATVNNAFLPAYTNIYSKTNKAGRRQFAGSWMMHLFLTGALVSTALYIFPKQVLLLLFNTNSPSAQTLLRILSPTPVIALFNALLMSIAYFKERYSLPPLIQLAGVVANAVVIALFGAVIGINALVYGFIASLIIQALFLLGFVQDVTLKTSLKKAGNIYSQWVPLIAATLLLRTDTWLLRLGAINTGEGAVSVVNYAAKIFALSSGVITSGINILLLPLLTKAQAYKNISRFKSIVYKGHAGALLVSVISTIGIVLLRKPIISLLFVRGEFTPDIGAKVAFLMLFFIPSAIGWGMFQVVAAPFFALQRQTIVAVISSIGLICAIVVILAFKKTLGILTAPTAVNVMMTLNTVLLALIWYIKQNNFLNKKNQIHSKHKALSAKY